MKKIVLTTLFVFGFIFSGYSVDATSSFYEKAPVLKYTQTLRQGTVNANVLALQKKLKEFGFYHKKLDSDYGSGTIAAVKKFQRAKGLKDDGIAGPKTYAMILATNLSGIKPDFQSNIKSCTKEYEPVCGQVEVQCVKAPCLPQKKTFSNFCMAGLADANILYKGKCKTKRLQTNSENVSKQCLEISNSNIENKNLSVGDNNKIISEFTLKNRCMESVKIHHVGFNVISSHATSQFNNIKISVGEDSLGLRDISINPSSYFNGDHLGFDYNVSDTSQLEIIRPNHDIEITVRADINGLSPFNSGSNFYGAFSVGLIDLNYTLPNEDQYRIDNLDVYSSMVIVNHNN